MFLQCSILTNWDRSLRSRDGVNVAGILQNHHRMKEEEEAAAAFAVTGGRSRRRRRMPAFGCFAWRRRRTVTSPGWRCAQLSGSAPAAAAAVASKVVLVEATQFGLAVAPRT